MPNAGIAHHKFIGDGFLRPRGFPRTLKRFRRRRGCLAHRVAQQILQLPHVQRAADHAVASVAADIPAQGERLFRRLRLDHGGAFLHQIAHAERLRCTSPLSSLFISSTLLTSSSRKPEATMIFSRHSSCLACSLTDGGRFRPCRESVDRGADVVAHAAQKIRLSRVRASGLRNGLAKLALLLQLALPFSAVQSRVAMRTDVRLPFLSRSLFEQAG